MEEVLVNVEVSCKSGAQPTFPYIEREMCCQEISVYFIGIWTVSVHHIWSASVASLTDLSLKKKKKKIKCSNWKETNFSLIKKKKKRWSALGVLGNCVLKKWSYISEDTPVTLACQEDGRCRKSTHRRRTPGGAKGEKLYPLRFVFIHKEKLSLACLFGSRGVPVISRGAAFSCRCRG